MRRLSAARIKAGRDSAFGIRRAGTLTRNALGIVVDDDSEIVDFCIASEMPRISRAGAAYPRSSSRAELTIARGLKSMEGFMLYDDMPLRKLAKRLGFEVRTCGVGGAGVAGTGCRAGWRGAWPAPRIPA